MKKYGLVGYPLGHSFSRKFFSEKFERENLDAEYLNFEIPDISLLMNTLSSVQGLKGVNVTIPYKEQTLSFLNELDDEAKKIGAINVIRISHADDGAMHLKGYNTDIVGFQQSIAPLLGECHKKALVLGTGGASKAIVRGLENLGIQATLVSRKPSARMLSYDDLTESVMAEYRVVVNTTPLGTFPNIENAPDIPYQYLTTDHLLYDLVYNPAETLFMKKGKEYGAQVKNGLEMLQLQALAAWNIWNETEEK